MRPFCEERGWDLVVTSDKEGENSEFQKHIVDADVLITTPFHPAYLTREIIAKAKNLKLCQTAGVGSDHVDLDAANERKITVTEVTGSNVVSVAEHVVMQILILVRNYTPAHEQIMAKEWDVAAIAKDAYDLEGKVSALVRCQGRFEAREFAFTVLIRCMFIHGRSLEPLALVASVFVSSRGSKNSM